MDTRGEADRDTPAVEGIVVGKPLVDNGYDIDGKLELERHGKTDKKAKGRKEEKEEDHEEMKRATIRDLFRFADTKDWILFMSGMICAAITGALFPLMGIIFGDAMDAFFPYDQSEINRISLLFLLLAIGLGVFSWAQYTLFAVSAARQVQKLRGESLRATLRQEIAWYDKSEANKVSSRIAGDTVIIQEGMGQKFGDVIKLLVQFVTGYIIGFARGWKMTLVMMAALPLLVISMGIFAWALNKYTKKGQDAYAEAGAVVEETFGGIRTTAAINLQKMMYERYQRFIGLAEVINMKGSLVASGSIGFLLFCVFGTYALGWWFGGKLVSEKDSQVNTVGDVTKVFFSVMIGSMSVAQIGPNARAVADALGALSSVLAILDRESQIDCQDPSGLQPSGITGHIKLENIHFTYPSRPNAKILQGMSLEIQPGQTVALVGASGSGKSTIISLLQRFYDTDAGKIELDGTDIRQLNLKWLRSKTGLVSQEPILFSGTIAENIAYGVTNMGRTVTQEEIEAAAKKANAHKFIESFPNGYNTAVGEQGMQLSGGQKQRIAIARAIIREPSILLLDEATSALDTESERVVQEALDALLEERQRTCLVVAHRLSTIRNADLIAVFKDGVVAELGKHDELMGIEDGIYKSLVQLQLSSKKESQEEYDRKKSIVSAKSLRDGLRSVGSRKMAGMQLDDAMEKAEKGQKTVMDSDKNMWLRLAALNKPRWPVALLGFLCALASGATFPVWAIILTDMMTALGMYVDDGDKLYDEICRYSIYYTVFSVAVGIITFVQIYSYSFMGEKITVRLREMTFEAMVRQDIGYFDMEENATGALAARLATEAKLVKSIAGETLGQVTQNISTLICALLIAFIMGSWKISLVLCAILPLMIFTATFQSRFMHTGMERSQEHIVESGKRATEAISSIRTVAAFGLEDTLVRDYYKTLEVPGREEKKKGILGGASVGGAGMLAFMAYSLVFWYGGKLVDKGEITFDECMKSLMTIMFAAIGIAQTSSFMTDTTAARNAAKKIFETVDREPQIDSTSNKGKKLDRMTGMVELKDVYFSYPSRPEHMILCGLSLNVNVGQTVALVGESGCGKSTVISLVERFYDPDGGTVVMDGRDITELNLKWLRDQIGLVGQEPILFQGTIAENIAMGKPGGATQAEIEEAAKSANAHDFIQSFPLGYNTEVGTRGVQLSGGQKQRIAIARAMIKNPAILLLDEATSALDAESEKVVQEALDRLLAAKQMTTIVIAHRLSTIKNADCIVVIRQGKMVEKGTHDQLMALNGAYTKLHRTIVQ